MLDFSKIKILYNKDTSCDYHRIYLPFKELGYDFEDSKTVQDCRLLIFNRLPSFSNNILFSLKRKLHIKYIIDLDDFWFLGEDHFLSSHYNTKKIPERIIELIENADAVTVTNTQLADEAKKINKNVYVIPNAVPVGKDQFKYGIENPYYATNFIYTGGTSHLEDIKLISDPLYKENISFTLAGYNATDELSVAMRNVLPKTINLIPHKPLHQYMSVYDYMDVSLVPLVNNTFNRNKSNLKIIEAGCKGLAVVCSKTLPYYNDIDKKFVDYAETNDDWLALIRYFKRNPSYAADRGKALFQHINKNYNLTEINKLRIELINLLLN